MDEDIIHMQQAAERRVRRMQERSRQLLENGPTFGAGLIQPPPEPAKAAAPDKRAPESQDHWLILLLLLLLAQNGGSRTLLTVLAYLAL